MVELVAITIIGDYKTKCMEVLTVAHPACSSTASRNPRSTSKLNNKSLYPWKLKPFILFELNVFRKTITGKLY